MKEHTLVRRYTQSLFAVGEKLGLTDRLREDLACAAGAWEDGDLRRVLSAPAILISDREKKDVLAALFASRLSEICMNFLSLLVDKNRTDILGACRDDFEALVYESRNIEVARVESAFPLSDAQRQRLTEALEKHLGKKLIVGSVTVNPELIGGLRVTVSDDVLDFSLSAAMTDMKRSLLSL
ncbi:MAG: ATP synthase F1 subunit delta [Abditibacteriota bacterium]|nr:ATP synthase F1 subunit delta [Abditibacteriota bacterium]